MPRSQAGGTGAAPETDLSSGAARGSVVRTYPHRLPDDNMEGSYRAPMLYLTTPSTPPVREVMRAGILGAMLNPGDRKSVADLAGITCAIDNGCFGDKWREDVWLGALDRYADTAPIFVVAPDVVGDAAATLERSRPWLAPLRDRGFQVAYVGQDGIDLEVIPWDGFDVFFVGGTDDWKLSSQAFGAAVVARERGKHTHLGRVNSLKRLRYAVPFFDTADGTFIKFGPNINLGRIIDAGGWLDELDRLPQLVFGGDGL